MKEQPKQNCPTCKYAEDLPFANELICMNENSNFADCPCQAEDTCDEFEERES